MDGEIKMFSQNEILLMILVVSVLLIFIIILTILDIKEYKREKNKIDIDLDDQESVLNEEMVDFKPMEDDVVEVLETNDSIVTNEVFEENNHEIQDVIEPLKIDEEISINENNNMSNDVIYEEEEIVPKKVSINEELLKIEETMVDTDEKLENTITSFEEEQERTAIISLDELLKHSDNLYSQNEITQYNDDNAPISIDEAINTLTIEPVVSETKKIDTPMVLEETLKEEKPLYTHKEEMPFISSIYGFENDDMSFENTANYEKMDRAKTNEFMRRLKEMNENK